MADLPNPITLDHTFLRANIERVDQQTAILTDIHDVLQKMQATFETFADHVYAVKDAVDSVRSAIIDVETAIEKQQTPQVNVNFDVEQLAVRLHELQTSKTTIRSKKT